MRQTPEDFGIRERFPDRRNDGLGPLQEVMAVGRIKIGVFKMRAGWQHHISVAYRVCQNNVTRHGKQILTCQAPFHGILIRMDDYGIMVVDEQPLDRRTQIGVEQITTNSHNVQGPGVWSTPGLALQPPSRFRKRCAGPLQQTATHDSELAGQGWESKDSTEPTPAILIAFRSIAGADDGRGYGLIPGGKLLNLRGLNPTLRRGLSQRQAPCLGQECFSSEHMQRDEGVVEAPDPFQLSRQGPGQYHICARFDGQMQIGFACHWHTARIDHHQLGTTATGSVNVGHEVHLRYGDIVAPDKNQLRLSHVFRSHQGDSAVGAYEGFTFHATAQRTARQIRGAKPVKKSQIHRTAGEKAMRTSIVERDNRLSTECLLDVCKTRTNKI